MRRFWDTFVTGLIEKVSSTFYFIETMARGTYYKRRANWLVLCYRISSASDKDPARNIDVTLTRKTSADHVPFNFDLLVLHLWTTRHRISNLQLNVLFELFCQFWNVNYSKYFSYYADLRAKLEEFRIFASRFLFISVMWKTLLFSKSESHCNANISD